MSDHPAPEATEPEQEEAATPPRLPGVAYPLIAMVFAGILVWSFSRVLLAASGFHVSIGGWKVELSAADVSVGIALFAAANVLVGAALVAYGPRVRGRTVALPMLTIAAVLVVVAGGVGMALGDRPGEAGGGEGGPPTAVAVTVVASGLQFDQAELTIPSGAQVQLTLDNRDAGLQHNLSIYRDEAGTQPIFQGEIFQGPAAQTYAFAFDAPPGSYFFRCDVHPQQMKGTVAATAPGEGPGGGGPGGGEGPGGGGAVDLAANGIAFDPTALTAPADAPFTIHFSNQDANTPHNVSIFDGPDATAPAVFNGDLVTGPGEIDYHVGPLPAGTYFFHCDVHPQQMTGTITLSG